MNNFHIEIPWWAGMIFVTVVIAMIIMLVYFMYEALLKFMIVWKHGYPTQPTRAQIEKQINEILLNAMSDAIEKGVHHG